MFKMNQISEAALSMLHNIDKMSVPSVETMLNQRCKKLLQRFFNIDMTLLQCFLTWPQRQLVLY